MMSPELANIVEPVKTKVNCKKVNLEFYCCFNAVTVNITINNNKNSNFPLPDFLLFIRFLQVVTPPYLSHAQHIIYYPFWILIL